MNYDLTTIASKAAEAASKRIDGTLMAVDDMSGAWQDHTDARIAFAQSVIEQIGAGETIQEIIKSRGQYRVERDEWRKKAEAAEAELRSLTERDIDDVVRRDGELPMQHKERLPALIAEMSTLAPNQVDDIMAMIEGAVADAKSLWKHVAKPTTPTPPEGFRVTFTDGKIDPPPFGEWHRQDWTPEMLPGGMRPYLLGEPQTEGDEWWNTVNWVTMRNNSSLGRKVGIDGTSWCPHRTTRPLPAPPEQVVEEWGPLEAEDVPPGSVFRNEHWKKGIYITPSLVGAERVTWTRCDYSTTAVPESLPFKALMDQWQILRPGQTEWQPCKKLKKKEAA